VFPRALLQWEDFASRNAFRVLARHRGRILSFNDDIEGTGAVVTAGIRSALRHVGRRLSEERIVFFGTGASGAGSALAVRRALRFEGVAEGALSSHVLCLDSRGLILRDRPGVASEKAALAADPALVHGWRLHGAAEIGLKDVVHHFRPTILVGASGQAGAFTQSIVGEMLRHCPRPIILPISNPTANAEATPADLLRWTGGAAVVGTGSPFPPVPLNGITYEIGQGNNVLIFPGVGLGALAVGARRISDGVFTAAADALHRLTEITGRPGEAIFPPLSRLRDVSFHVALAVGTALVDEGVADPRSAGDMELRIRKMIWEPVYRPYRPA
jgi:malate dehydrogenase (oxaloacetate-decarboxylating)